MGRRADQTNPQSEDFEAQLRAQREDFEAQLRAQREDFEAQLRAQREDLEVQLGAQREDLEVQLGAPLETMTVSSIEAEVVTPEAVFEEMVRQESAAKSRKARPLTVAQKAKIARQRLEIAKRRNDAQVTARVLRLNAEDLGVSVEEYSEALRSL